MRWLLPALCLTACTTPTAVEVRPAPPQTTAVAEAPTARFSLVPADGVNVAHLPRSGEIATVTLALGTAHGHRAAGVLASRIRATAGSPDLMDRGALIEASVHPDCIVIHGVVQSNDADALLAAFLDATNDPDLTDDGLATDLWAARGNPDAPTPEHVRALAGAVQRRSNLGVILTGPSFDTAAITEALTNWSPGEAQPLLPEAAPPGTQWWTAPNAASATVLARLLDGGSGRGIADAALGTHIATSSADVRVHGATVSLSLTMAEPAMAPAVLHAIDASVQAISAPDWSAARQRAVGHAIRTDDTPHALARSWCGARTLLPPTPAEIAQSELGPISPALR